jgi:hypothetical protein
VKRTLAVLKFCNFTELFNLCVIVGFVSELV